MFYNTADLRTDEIYLQLTSTAEADERRGFVPSYNFTIRRTGDDAEVGYCDLRVGNNENTYYGGNIGYGITEPHRGSHYAAKACLLLFRLAMRHGMKKLIITCSPDNYASRRTCEYLGGVLEAIVDLPRHNDMYLAGERRKCVYRFRLRPQQTRQADSLLMRP